jgi:signal transduction histidine kinase
MWEKVVLNLLSNAFKFTFTGEIAVSLRAEGGRVELSVRDTGTGIPKEELPHIFERFHQVKGARGRSYEGSGIGLALVQELVRLHGGEVRVESTLGQGTVFTLSLPFGNAHLPQERLEATALLASTATGTAAYVQEASGWQEHFTAPEAPASHPSGRARPRRAPAARQDHILLVDDNADMREYVRRLLEGPYTVEAVESGTQALKAARTRSPDLVLSDVMMPGLDGFGLLRELKADPRTATVPVILLSARAGEEATVEGLEAGADDYLVKPFGARELVARVEGTLKAARAKAERERVLEFEQQLIGIVSHDLRNPLNAILLGATALTRCEALDARAAKSVRRIQDSAERATRLVKDLLDFTQARLGGGIPLRPGPMDLHTLVRQVVEEVEVAYPERKLEVRQQGEAQGEWDSDRIAQVIGNLVTNALKYSPEDTPVRLITRAEAGWVSLSVSNGGAPIPAGKLSSIFEPLQRATAEVDKAGRSVGLGLYIVRHIVGAHGGTIDVTSTEAEGTTFTVRLPRGQR